MKTRTNLSAAFLSLTAVLVISGSAYAGEKVSVSPIQPQIESEETKPAPGVVTADFNHDGAINSLDIFDYLSAFMVGQDNADADGDGMLTGLDVLAYINIWFGYTPTPVLTGPEPVQTKGGATEAKGE